MGEVSPVQRAQGLQQVRSALVNGKGGVLECRLEATEGPHR